MACPSRQYDHSFWAATLVTEFDLVCDRASFPVLAKMIFFSGFGVGTFLSGLVSDTWGRRRAILLFSVLMLGITLPHWYGGSFVGHLVASF